MNGGIGATTGGNGRGSGDSAGAEDNVTAYVRVRRGIVMGGGFSAPHFQGVVFAVLIVAFQIKVGEVERDSVLRRRFDLPNAVFVRWVEFREGRRGDGAVDGFDVTAASVFASLSIRVKFESDATLAFVPPERVDALVFASVFGSGAFVVFFHEASSETSLLDASVADEFDVEFVGMALDVVGDFVAAILADERGSFVVTVADFQIVVDATVVVFHFERLEFKGDGEGFGDGNLPDAFFVRSVVVRVVRAAQLSAF